MSYTTGILTLTHGVSTITGYVVQNYGLSSDSALKVAIPDENGVIVYRYYNDITNTLSFNAYLAGATLPLPGAAFSYGGVTYEVQTVDKKYSNKDAINVDIKGIKSAGI